MYLVIGVLLQGAPYGLHLGSLAADNDARARGVEVHGDLVGSPLDNDIADGRMVKILLEVLPDLQVLMEYLCIIAVGVPAGVPILITPSRKPMGFTFWPN